MAITTLDGLIASAKQRFRIVKTASRTSVANSWFSVFDQVGDPGAGTLAGTSTTTGTVPTDATAGCSLVSSFGSNKGYLAGVTFSNTVPCRIMVYDMLWKGGAYAFNANTSGNTPTSFSGRVPNGTDFVGCELWLEQVTAGTLVQNVAVTYTDQSGNTGHTTGTVATAANIVGRMWPLPLAAGDSGVQAVTGVVGSTASAGTFNILVLRPLMELRVPLANGGDAYDYLRTGLPEIFDTSALCIAVCADSTATGLPEVSLLIAQG